MPDMPGIVRIALAACATLAVSGCIVVAHPAPAQTPEPPAPAAGKASALPPGAANGRPANLRPGAPEAYWVWHDDKEWHVRTTTASHDHRFRGRVVPDGTATLSAAHSAHTEQLDQIRSNPGGIAFDFRTKGHEDGFDFAVSANGCARFDLQIDAGPRPDRIFIGSTEQHPASHHFTACP